MIVGVDMADGLKRLIIIKKEKIVPEFPDFLLNK